MNFLKQAASFAGGNKDEQSSGASSGGFDVNNLSDMMSKAEGFLAEKKPVVAHETPAAEEEGVVKKPVEEEEEEEAPKPTIVKEDTEEVSEKPSTSTESAEPVEAKEETPEVAAPTQAAPAPVPVDTKPSYSELYGDAQTLYSGVQGKLGGKTDVDDKELAGAAENLLQGATELGVLKADSPYSDYFKKAEGFLHGYGSSASAPKEDESA